MTTARISFATRPSASVVGPGTGSARSNAAWSSRWQKYCERNSSGRQITCAPWPAASRTRRVAVSRLATGSGAQRICTRPTRNFRGAGTARGCRSGPRLSMHLVGRCQPQLDLRHLADQVPLGQRDGAALLVGPGGQQVDHLRPALSIGVPELVEADCRLEVLPPEGSVAQREQLHARHGYATDLARAYRVHDPMTVHQALDQQRPIALLDHGRVADEESHRHIEKPALEIPAPYEHRGMTRMHWLEPHRNPPGGWLTQGTCRAGRPRRAGVKCVGGGAGGTCQGQKWLSVLAGRTGLQDPWLCPAAPGYIARRRSRPWICPTPPRRKPFAPACACGSRRTSPRRGRSRRSTACAPGSGSSTPPASWAPPGRRSTAAPGSPRCSRRS